MRFVALIMTLFTFTVAYEPYSCILAEIEQCSSSSSLTSELRQVVVDLHNKLRSSVALGIALMRGGQRSPSASNMNKLVYDCDLENETQEWVDKCKMSHSSDSRNASENLYMAFNYDTTAAYHLRSAIMTWFNEIHEYNVSEPNNLLTGEMFNTGIGHFTAMSWATSTRVGCGFSNHCKFVFFACRYRPTGNVLGFSIYLPGPACSRCAADKQCLLSEGLCY
ncbi:unnamed protein product [Enterobius vermicularis]|uniref:SCP domain-containing protein n=1 Tax=Enterobius vermicularis TaxID=51028 RepID=A0A0N4VHU9_ENTVE|nr:unnamed protein product [Enterobius vermicularis]